MSNLFAQCWKGEASLAKAFWIVYLLFGILLRILIAVVLMMVVENYSYVNYQQLITAIKFPYTLFSIICVWRCAKNSFILWNLLARLIVILFFLISIIHVLGLVRRLMSQ